MADMKSMREQFRRLLEADHLSEEEFAALEALQGKSPASEDRLWFRPAAIAAMVSMVFIGALFLGTNFQSGAFERTLVLTAEEVHANHINIHTLDIESSSLEEIRATMTLLNFVPIETGATQGKNLSLLGARYCTLQGVIATQLMFTDQEGGLVTVYQAVYDAERFGQLPDIARGQKPISLIKDGVVISVWVEQGVVVAQAKSNVVS